MSTQPSRSEISVAEAADQMRVNHKTIRRMIASGQLPARRIGNRLIRIRQADLDALGTPIGPGEH